MRDEAAHEQAMLDAANREERLRKERLSKIERDCEDLHERDEARQRAREAARRHRNELEQTVDLDQQRIAVSCFLEQASGPSRL